MHEQCLVPKRIKKPFKKVGQPLKKSNLQQITLSLQQFTGIIHRIYDYHIISLLSPSHPYQTELPLTSAEKGHRVACWIVASCSESRAS